MRRVMALALGLVVGCGDTKPTGGGGEKSPSASEVFDKTEKDMKPSRGAKEKKASGIG